jgi:hypothetical protein
MNAFEAGGMEYETFFTTMGSNEFPMNAEGVTRAVTVHEFGHGYFMGLLASNEFEEPFLDEGMNQLWETRTMAADRNQVRLPALARWLGIELPSIAAWDVARLIGGSRRPADPIAGNSWNRWSTESYALVYHRTALVFHDLEQVIGADTFERAMKLYYDRWRFRHPSTADLLEAFVDAGADRATVERWFETQVHGAAPIDDRVVEVRAEEVLPELGSPAVEGKRTEVTGKARDKAVADAREAWKKEHGEPAAGKPGPFPWKNVVTTRRRGAEVPQVVLVTFEDGTEERLEWPPGRRWGRWELVRPVKVRSAQIDPDRTVFLDIDKLDDGRTREARKGPAARLALGAGGWIQFLLSLVEAM